MKFTRFVGRTSRDKNYRAALRNSAVRKMDLRPAEGNLTLDFTIDGIRSTIEMSPVVRDLLDLSAMIYTVDELAARTTGADGWTRSFDAVIPVRSPTAWRKASAQLEDILYFLSGDSFQFQWTRTRSVPDLRRHRATISDGFDSVCLFSGGADSLVGAYELLESGKKVILVGHQADGITAATQDRVFQFFKTRYGESTSFVQARVGRSPRSTPEFDLGKKVETNHRPRSFVFLSLAIAVAKAAKVEEIVMPENGLIALNPPLNASRVGTLSTRTAHPRFISGFVSFVRHIGAFRGRIYNPFLYMSKSDVIRRTPRPLRTILRQTLSCSHLGRTRWTGSRCQHCGYCVPCLYRRIAFAELGLDNPADYYRDVFTQFGSLTLTERSDIRALTGFARRVEGMTTAQRIGVTLSHGASGRGALATIGPEIADPYVGWAEMLARWTREFLEIVRTRASRDARSQLNI